MGLSALAVWHPARYVCISAKPIGLQQPSPPSPFSPDNRHHEFSKLEGLVYVANFRNRGLHRAA